MDRLSRLSQELEGFWFESPWISPLLFADDVALLVPSGRDLGDLLEVVSHRACLSISTSEATLYERKKGVFLLHIRRSQLRCLDTSVRRC